MNLADLTLFIEIYRTQSISIAAANLFQTQSTVSKRLTVLEKELNCRLFQRGRGIPDVKPTIAGEQLYPKALQITLLWEDVVKECSLRKKYRMRVGAVDSVASYKLRAFFADLTKKKQDWELELILADSVMICEMIRDGRIDLGITNGEPFFSELDVSEIFSEKFMIYTRNPDFRNRTKLRLNELNPYSEIFHVYGSNYNAWHNAVIYPGCAKGKVNQVHMALALMQQPEDWIILPESVATALVSNQEYLYQLDEPELFRKVYLVSSINADFEKRQLIQEFRDALRNQKPEGLPASIVPPPIAESQS